MTIFEFTNHYSTIESDLLLSFILKKPKEFLYLNPNKQLNKIQLLKLKGLVRRRLNGEPMAYILGYKDFYGLKLKVNKNVLIPRPETEWLVDQVLKLIHPGHRSGIQFDFKSRPRVVARGGNIKVLDLGTGSGCIAISIKKNINDTDITASDISAKALTVAKANAKFHKTNIKFIKSDLFSNITEKFDLIIANLPYVPASDYKKLRNGLKYEPKSAITDGSNTAEIYKRFLKQVNGHLATKGIILLEIDPKTKKYLPPKTKFYKDLNGLWRYAEINNP